MLITSIDSMLKVISEISISNNESALGAQDIAERSSAISRMSNGVTKMSEEMEQSSKRLKDVVVSFRI